MNGGRVREGERGTTSRCSARLPELAGHHVVQRRYPRREEVLGRATAARPCGAGRGLYLARLPRLSLGEISPEEPSMSAEPRYAAPPRRRRWFDTKVLFIGAVLILAAGGAAVARAVSAPTACDPHRPLLEVVTSPDLAAAVSRVADRVHDAAGCSQARVRAEAPSAVLTALGQPSTRPPDVWIPDSSLWVQRARNAAHVVPVDQQSIASSPLVLAAPRAVRDQLTPSGATLQWPDVVNAMSTGQLVLHLPGDADTPSTVGILVALQEAAEQQPDPRAVLTGLLRAAQLQAGLQDGGQALAAAGSSANAAVPVSEQAVFSQAGTPGAPPLAALYPGAAGTPFDYPYTVLSADANLRTAAARLLTALRSTSGQALLRQDGFRGVDGVGDGLTADRGVDGTQAANVGVPDTATAGTLLKTLDAVRQEARLLAVVDVSGSMAAPVAGSSDGSSRLDLALRAAAGGLGLYPDATEVGLWSFSEDLSGTTDYQELVPIAPLTATGPVGRQAVAQAMARMQAVPDGGTGLYDTTLAAVRAVRAGWDPARVNAVVLLSDGEDTDADGISLNELLTTLRGEQASGQPVPVITIAYGDGSGAEALTAISDATGGATYRTSDPARIRDVFLDAVGQRACRPQCQPVSGN